MSPAPLLLLIVSGSLGVTLSQTTTTPIKYDSSKWVKSTEHPPTERPTEHPTKPTEHFWSSATKYRPKELPTGSSSSIKPELTTSPSTATPKRVTPTERPTEHPTKPTEHFWSSTTKHHSKELSTGSFSSIKPELTTSPSTATPKRVTVPDLTTTKTISEWSQCDCNKTLGLLMSIDKKVEDLEEEIELLSKKNGQQLQNTCTHCTIELTSVSDTDSNPEPQRGKIFVNGIECVSCMSKTSGSSSPDAQPGLATCTIDPKNCTIIDSRHFKTNNPSDDLDGKYLRAYLDKVPPKQLVAGTSCGDSVSGLGDDGKIGLMVYNVNVNDVKPNDQMTFVVQPGDPSKGRMDKSSASATPLNITYVTEGGTIKNLRVTKVNETSYGPKEQHPIQFDFTDF